MKTPIRTTGTSSSLRFIVTAMLSLCAAGTGFAQLVTNTWTGQGANVFWTTPGNWSGQNVPANGAVIIFTGPANLANSNNLTLGSYANSITFQAPAGPFILGNREFSVTNAISDSQIGTPETITVPLIITNLITINVTNGGEVDLLGTVTGTNGALDITGGGTVALTGITTNVFNGTSGVEVDGSTVAPAADLSLGTTNDLNVAQVGRLILNDGSLEGRVTNLVINPNRGISLGPTSGTGWGGFYVHAGNVLSYGGVITNNGTSSSSLSKAGYGTLDLFGANGFSGSTTNGIGVLLLDYTMPTSPTGNIIPSGSALTIGGGNAAGALNGAENVAELVMGGGAGADSQAFSSTFSTFGSSLIVATNGAGTVNLDLGALSHQAGGTLTFVTPEASGGGHVHTSTSNVNGILGGWALISGDHNTETFYTEPANGGGNHNNGLAHTVFISTNYAAVNASGDIVNYTNWFVATNTSTLAQQLVGMPETNIYFDGASANVLTVTNDNSGVTVDVNTITMSGTANGPGIFVGTNNTLRLGQFGGILLNSVGNNTYFIGGTNAAAQTGSGTHGSQDYGILTAGGPTLNTPGEIVIALDAGTGSSESAGSVIFETRITDNGTGPVTVVKTGPSSIKLDGHNTFSGGLYLLQGRVQFAGSELGSVTTTTNGDGGGSGNIYVLPGCYLFPSGIGADLITNHIFVAGGGDATEAFGTIRGGNFVGPISLIGDATIGCDTINISNGISGPYNLTFGALSRAGTVNLGGPQELLNPDNWTGNTILSAGGSSSPGSTLRENESGLIPHGIGYGNVTMTNGNAGQIIWDLHGNSETINGLNSYGVAARCFITNSVGTQSSLTVGDNDQSGIFGDAISGNIALAKIGAGVEVLTNIDNYTGNTTVSNGVLALVGSSSILNSPVVDIEGGTFDVSGESSYGFGVSQVVDVNNATLRILTASGGSVNMTNGVLQFAQLAAGGGLTSHVQTGGTTNLLQVEGIGPQGSYPVTFTAINYTGSTDTNFLTLGLELPSTNYMGYLTNDTVDSVVQVVITNGPITASITWTGGTDGNWNYTENNWEIGVAPTNFLDGDIVTFNDSASQTNVTLQLANLNPLIVQVDNTNLPVYKFSGVGSIISTNLPTVDKEGPGLLILDNQAANEFNGMNIGGGTVQVGNFDSVGAFPGTGNIADNGSLIIALTSGLSLPNNISGSGGLTVNGGNTGTPVSLSGNNTFSGPLLVTNTSYVQAVSANALGSGTNVTIASGSSLDMGGNNFTSLGQMTVGGSGIDAGAAGFGALFSSGADQTHALTNIVMTSDTTIGGSGRWDLRPGSGLASLSTGGQAYNLTKVGANQISLVSATIDPALANIDVQAGTLGFEGNSTGLGNPADTLTIESGAALEFYAATNQLNKTVDLLGSITNTSGSNFVAGAVSVSGPANIDVASGGLTFDGPVTNVISGDTLEINGGTETNNTTVVLNGSGNTTGLGIYLDDGTLVVNGVNSDTTGFLDMYDNNLNHEPVYLGGSGTFDGTVYVDSQIGTGVATLWPSIGGAPSTLTVGALHLAAEGGNQADAIFELGTSTSSGDDMVNASSMPTPGTVAVYIHPIAPLTNTGPYTLFNVTGGAPSIASFTVTTDPALGQSRYGYSLGTSGTKIQLNVTALSATLQWDNAQSNGLWDVAASTNWLYVGPNTNTAFYNLDSLAFNDLTTTAQTNTITIVTNVNPNSLVFNNTTNTYLLSGAGGIGGATGLEKDGTGILNLSNRDNTFSGAIAINAGTLTINTNSYTPDEASSITIANGATLDIGGGLQANNTVNLGTTPITVVGAGANGVGAIANLSTNAAYPGQYGNFHTVTMLGNTTIGATGRMDMRSATLTCTLSTGGNPYTLTVNPIGGTNANGQVNIVSVNVDPALGEVDDIGSGVFTLQGYTTLGDTNYNLVISTNAVLHFYDYTATNFDKPIVLEDGATLYNQHGANDIASAITLGTNAGANCVFNIGGNSFEEDGVISGPGNLIESTSGSRLTLTATNTYTGDTLLSDGTLTLISTTNATGMVLNGSIATSTNIIDAGHTIDVTGLTNEDDTLTLNAGVSQTLSGSGTIAGSLVSPVGTSVLLGTNSAVGTVTVTTNATLAGTTYVKLNPASTNSDVLSVTNGTLTYGGTIVVTNISAFNIQPLGTNSFRVFPAGTYTGSPTVQLPTVPGVTFDTSQLTVNGTILAISTAQPIPLIESISINGSALTLTATNNSAVNPATYYVLSSTNIALPLTNWTSVFTNTFDATGYTAFTNNLVDTNDLHQFFILSNTNY